MRQRAASALAPIPDLTYGNCSYHCVPVVVEFLPMVTEFLSPRVICNSTQQQIMPALQKQSYTKRISLDLALLPVIQPLVDVCDVSKRLMLLIIPLLCKIALFSVIISADAT